MRRSGSRGAPLWAELLTVYAPLARPMGRKLRGRRVGKEGQGFVSQGCGRAWAFLTTRIEADRFLATLMQRFFFVQLTGANPQEKEELGFDAQPCLNCFPQLSYVCANRKISGM